MIAINTLKLYRTVLILRSVIQTVKERFSDDFIFTMSTTYHCFSYFRMILNFLTSLGFFAGMLWYGRDIDLSDDRLPTIAMTTPSVHVYPSSSSTTNAPSNQSQADYTTRPVVVRRQRPTIIITTELPPPPPLIGGSPINSFRKRKV